MPIQQYARASHSLENVTLTRGAAALAMATNTLWFPFRPEASSAPERAWWAALGRGCHAKAAGSG